MARTAMAVKVTEKRATTEKLQRDKLYILLQSLKPDRAGQADMDLRAMLPAVSAKNSAAIHRY